VARHEGRDRRAGVNSEDPAYPSRECEKPRARAPRLRARSCFHGVETRRARGSEGYEVVAHAWRACASPKGEPEREPASNPRARATPRALDGARRERVVGRRIGETTASPSLRPMRARGTASSRRRESRTKSGHSFSALLQRAGPGNASVAGQAFACLGKMQERNCFWRACEREAWSGCVFRSKRSRSPVGTAERRLFASEASRRRRLSNAASRTIRTRTVLRRWPGSFWSPARRDFPRSMFVACAFHRCRVAARLIFLYR